MGGGQDGGGDDDDTAAINAAADVVAATAWDGPLEDARAARDRVCAVLGLDAIVDEEEEGGQSKKAQAAPAAVADPGYAALVTAVERGGG